MKELGGTFPGSPLASWGDEGSIQRRVGQRGVPGSDPPSPGPAEVGGRGSFSFHAEAPRELNLENAKKLPKSTK